MHMYTMYISKRSQGRDRVQATQHTFFPEPLKFSLLTYARGVYFDLKSFFSIFNEEIGGGGGKSLNGKAEK